mmetsp:Transcript_109342/g.316038  ORF Transcript_109342/g.316038 Transcript_109342/m.316038 type:complete len:230 (-) Transcript_109342:410-1099(-)
MRITSPKLSARHLQTFVGSGTASATQDMKDSPPSPAEETATSEVPGPPYAARRDRAGGIFGPSSASAASNKALACASTPPATASAAASRRRAAAWCVGRIWRVSCATLCAPKSAARLKMGISLLNCWISLSLPRHLSDKRLLRASGSLPILASWTTSVTSCVKATILGSPRRFKALRAAASCSLVTSKELNLRCASGISERIASLIPRNFFATRSRTASRPSASSGPPP